MQKLSIGLSVLALVLSGICLFLYIGTKQKIAYADLESVYNDFQMKKELEAKFQNVSQMRQSILDSLKIEVNVLSRKITSDSDKEHIQAFQAKRQEYLMKEQGFVQSNEETTSQYKAQIWKQLRQYARQYGKEKGYDYILGADPNNGNILYGCEPVNITETIKEYINNAYKGEIPQK